MIKLTLYKIFTICVLSIFILNSCAKEGFFKTGDARKNPPDPRERVKKNIEEGRGFRLNDAIGGQKGTNFEFASSNELWRASIDILDFVPFTNASYSGGILITEWFDGNSKNESSENAGSCVYTYSATFRGSSVVTAGNTLGNLL